MAAVNLDFMISKTVEAVVSLSQNDYQKDFSYSKIATEVANLEKKGRIVDCHGRCGFYNRVVKAVKLAVIKDQLRFVVTPIAGHDAQVALPFPFPDTKKKRGK